MNMNADHATKRLKKVDNDDRLSNLSDDLLHKILSFVSSKHAVQTSVLSSRWRFLWTSMPFLNFSRDDFSKNRNRSKFLRRLLRGRNDRIKVSSVNLTFCGNRRDIAFVKKIMNYAFSPEHLNLTCLLNFSYEFPPLCFRSESLKHLSLTGEVSSKYRANSTSSEYLKTTSNWELPALTTLSFHKVNFGFEFFSKFALLKNLTLKDCNKGCNYFTISVPLLSDLTIEMSDGSEKLVNLVAPQLKNLTLKNCFLLSTHSFLSLKKADICLTHSTLQDIHLLFREAGSHPIVRLLQEFHNVEFLTLNLEIVEVLSSSKELLSHPPSPFTKLRSLKIHATELSKKLEQKRVTMSAEAESFLLSSSPGATFTLVSHEEEHHQDGTEPYCGVTGGTRAGES